MSAHPGRTPAPTNESAAAVLTRSWVLDDLLTLPDDGNRYEIFDGQIHVTPPPTPLHQRVARRLAALVEPAARALDAEVLEGVGLRLPDGAGERYVVPDLLVVTGPTPPLYYEAAAVLVVVEVESPGSRLTDRGTKRALYADAGIPEYWLVDPARRRLTPWRLADGEYAAGRGSALLPPVDWEALTRGPGDG